MSSNDVHVEGGEMSAQGWVKFMRGEPDAVALVPDKPKGPDKPKDKGPDTPEEGGSAVAWVKYMRGTGK